MKKAKKSRKNWKIEVHPETAKEIQKMPKDIQDKLLDVMTKLKKGEMPGTPVPGEDGMFYVDL